MSAMTIQEIKTEATNIGILQAQVKAWSMIYQARTKEAVAAHYGIAFEKIAHLPYPRWERLRTRYTRESSNA